LVTLYGYSIHYFAEIPSLGFSRRYQIVGLDPYVGKLLLSFILRTVYWLSFHVGKSALRMARLRTAFYDLNAQIVR
jgi:hypothetical protein